MMLERYNEAVETFDQCLSCAGEERRDLIERARENKEKAKKAMEE